jgi:competence protein ComGC
MVGPNLKKMAKKANTKKEATTKKPTTKKVEKVTLDHSKTYSIEALSGKHLIKGNEYQVSGDVAEILVNSGQAKLK